MAAAIGSATAATPQVTKTVVSSTGDPHIQVTQDAGSQKVASLKYNDQQNVANLAGTKALGGVHVSTQVTALNSHGVAYNKAVEIYDKSAHVKVKIYDTTDGNTIEENVKVTADGKTVVNVQGASESLDGTVTANGVTVSDNGKGEVSVAIASGNQSFDVAVSQNGHGLNVTATGTNVKVGGAAVKALVQSEKAAAPAAAATIDTQA
jgi:hypothetical protein